MMIIVFFSVVILFAIVLNVAEKIKAYHSKEHSVWEDGDSVVVHKEEPKHPGFSHRIA